MVARVASGVHGEYQLDDSAFHHEYRSIINDVFGIACIEGQLDVARWFLESAQQLSLDIDLADQTLLDVNAPLLDAWCNGHVEVVKALIAAGATEHLARLADDPNRFFRHVIYGSFSDEAEEYHGGNRDALFDLLITEGVPWSPGNDMWEDVSIGGTLQLMLHMVDIDNDAHAAEYIHDAMYYSFDKYCMLCLILQTSANLR
jgi:hypothetical protein